MSHPTATPVAASASRRSRVRPALAVLAVVACLPAVGSSAVPAAADSSALRLDVLRHVSLGPEGGRAVIVDSSARRAIVFCEVCPQGGATGVAVRDFDLDTGRMVAHLDANDPTGRLFAVIQQDNGYALDEPNHRLFKLAGASSPIGTMATVVVLDTRTLAVLGSFSTQATERNAGLAYSPVEDVLYAVDKQPFSAYQVWAYSADPASLGKQLWTRPFPECAADTSVPASNAQLVLGITRDARYLFTVCEPHPGDGSSGSRASAAVLRLALPAAGSPVPLLPSASGAPIYNGQVDIYPGLVTGSGGYFFDAFWIPGKERILALGPANGGGGTTMTVFDTATLSYVSTPTVFVSPSPQVLYEAPSVAVDPVSGRVFGHSLAHGSNADPVRNCSLLQPGSNSFVVVDAGALSNRTAAFPSPEPDMSTDWWGSYANMGYDVVAHDVVMVDDTLADANGCWGVKARGSDLVFMHDAVPYDQPGVDDPDAATQDLAETQGLTASNVTARVSAYGIRQELAPSGTEGPLSHVYVNPSVLTCDLSSFSYLTNLLQRAQRTVPPVPPQYHDFCTSAARVASFAHVNDLHLDNAEVSAQAVAGDSDRATASDLTHGTDLTGAGQYADAVSGYAGAGQPCASTTNGHCAPPSQAQPYLSGESLPYTPAACADDSGQPTDQSDSHGDAARVGQQPDPESRQPDLVSPVEAPGGAAVACSFQAQAGTARAEESGTSIGLPIFAQSAVTTASVTRRVGPGSESQAGVVIDGISVGDVLHIDRLAVSADARAHGHRRSAKATYTCTVQGLATSISGQVPIDVSGTVPCSDPSVQQAAAQVTHAFDGQVQVEFPLAYADPATAPLGAAGVVVRGTPGGYLAQVQASELRRDQNTVLLNDGSLEHAAMVVTLVGDSGQRHVRMVTSFGGVAVSATYGIFALPQFDAIPSPDFPGVVLPAVPDTGTTGAAPMPVAALGSTGGETSPATARGPASILQRALQAVVDGLQVLWQHPGVIPPLLAVWALLGAPAYVLQRRRQLAAVTTRRTR